MTKKEKSSQTDPKIRRQRQVLFGGGLFLLGLLLIISFVSYYFNWKEDYSSLESFFDKSVPAKNILSKVGALVSHLFMHQGVGFASLLFPYLLCLSGFKLFFDVNTANQLDIINLLPEHIANQIAAGEVIQRPASVVKETLENSIDSGASEIQLIIKDAGKTLIQVIDNGCGMSNNDVEKCFLRHATSKIKKANDLFAIQTMGFRGEAMASIASISHVELDTKLLD